MHQDIVIMKTYREGGIMRNLHKQFMKTGLAIGALALALATAPVSTPAQAGDFSQAIEEGKIILDMRFRYEMVDQEPVDDNANAFTLRTRFGFETGEFHNFKALIEGEHITALGDEKYNNTNNGKAQYPVVADPDGTELNRVQLSYTGIDNTSATIGRQRINLGNQRFIGAVGFRQNEQTMDSLVLVNKSVPNTTLVYGYIDEVHRIFGNNHAAGNLDTNAHVVNVVNTSLPYGTLTVNGYWLDVQDVDALSTQTYGFRYNGKQAWDDFTFLYDVEYAHQSDHADNPNSFSLNFYSITGGVKWSNLTAKVNYEVLEGDGAVGFTTPLATLHKFQGFADKFLGTPGNGVKDIGFNVAYQVQGLPVVKGMKLAVWYHKFKAENGGMDYGDEIDFLIGTKWDHNISAAIKYAHYNAKGWKSDTDKLWLTLGYAY